MFVKWLLNVNVGNKMYNLIGMYFVFKLAGGLEINLQPRGQLTEKDNMSLQCTADKFTFEKLSWYKLSAHVSQTPFGGLPMPVCKNLNALQKLNATVSNTNGENVTLELILRNISLQDGGDYVCIAQDKKAKTQHCLVKHLTVQGMDLLP